MSSTIVPRKRSSRDVTLPSYAAFGFSSLSPMLAVIFTNPFDVAKVRMQLQRSGPKVYKNTIDCMIKLIKHEGLLALEKGLSTAVMREGSKNFFRIGLYDPVLKLLHAREENGKRTPAPVYKRLAAGAVSGVFGALACNPFEILKTRFQAQGQSGASTHQYTSVRQAFRSVVTHEGWGGLYKGSSVSMVRSAIGTSVNVTGYTVMREHVLSTGLMKDGPVTDMTCSCLSAVFTAITINPVDVVRTRLYNQPTDAHGNPTLYRNGLHCMRVIVSSEGPSALMKGSALMHGKGVVPAFLRLGPHFVLTFVFLEQMRRMGKAFMERRELRQEVDRQFALFDADGSGDLTMDELVFALQHIMPRYSGAEFMKDDEYLKHVRQTAQTLMERADVDRSGTIDKEEFLLVCEDARELLHEGEMARAFASIDMDGNGVLDRTELQHALERAVVQQSMHRMMDMTLEEIKAGVAADVERMLELADADGDGNISFSEFMRVSEMLDDAQQGRAVQNWMLCAGIAQA